jgi:hypothetical protein
LKHAHGSSEGLTLVNPDNKSQFVQISHKRQWIWASAIVNSHAGVDDTHPPTGHEFEWESCTANIPVIAGTTATQAIRTEDRFQPSSFQPAHIGKSNSSAGLGSDVSVVAPSPVTSQNKHFQIHSESPERENKLPRVKKPREMLTPLGVEHLGRMEEYLAMCHIAIDDHYTRILIEHNKITHWNYF